MSAVLAYHLGACVVIASDSRIVKYDKTFTNILWRSDRETDKLRRWTHGLVAGVGSVPLIDGILRRLADVRTVGDMLNVIAEERETMAAALRGYSDHYRTEVLGHTNIVLTFRNSERALRLAYHAGQGAHGLASLPPGALQPFLPTCDALEDLTMQLQEVVLARLANVARGEPVSFTDIIAAAIGGLREALAAAASIFPSVGGSTVIGVHHASGEIRTLVYPSVMAPANWRTRRVSDDETSRIHEVMQAAYRVAERPPHDIDGPGQGAV